MKKHLSVLLMLCCIAINLFAPHWASAAASEYYSKRLSDLVGLSEQNYYVDEQLTDKVAIIDLFCQNKRIEIDEAYMVEFVDIIGTMKNHIYVNLSSLVKVTFDNPTIAEYNKAIQLNPNFDMAYNNLGVAYEHTKNYIKAKEAFEKAYVINPKQKYKDNFASVAKAISGKR